MIRFASSASMKTASRCRPATSAKPPKKSIERRLRDYAAEFDEMARRRIAILTDIDAVKKESSALTQAEEAAKKIQAFRENERTKLTSDLAGLKKERAAIEKHLAEVNKLLARARQLTADLLDTQRTNGRRTRRTPIASPQTGWPAAVPTDGQRAQCIISPQISRDRSVALASG